MLEQARVNNPGSEIQQADVESLPFEDGSFDFVLCVEVLRYLPDPEPCIREMARVLKPGGVCLATAAPTLNLNGYFLVNRIANLRKVGNLVQLKQFFTTSARLRSDFERAGFSQTKINGVYTGPVNWVERLAPRVLPSVLRKWESLDKHLSDQPFLREFSNMFLAHAIKRN
jgi:ubiquinone/menaquinone biosynthesis C-methylase UbiE